jgi:hypothetical protein
MTQCSYALVHPLALLWYLYLITCSYTTFCHASHHQLIIILADQEESLEKTLAASHTRNNGPVGMGPLTHTLLIALDQEAAPIIVSKTIVDNLLGHMCIFHDFITHDKLFLQKKYSPFSRFSSDMSINRFQEACLYMHKAYQEVNQELKKLIHGNTINTYTILKRITNNKKFLENGAPSILANHTYNPVSKAIYQEIMTYTMCSQFTTLSKNWIIKQLHNVLLFIPAYYVQQYSCAYTPKEQKLSPLELLLGLKINHLPDSTCHNFTKGNTTSQDSLIKYLKALFVTNDDYTKTKNNLYKIPRWILYLMGHGGQSENLGSMLKQLKTAKALYDYHGDGQIYEHYPNALYLINSLIAWIEGQIWQRAKEDGEAIASLSISDFTRLLLFLNTEITTHLLFYSSCYSGGELLIRPYTQGKKSLLLHYPIIAGTLAENSTYQELPMLHLPPYRHVTIGGKKTICGITAQALDIKRKQLALTTHIDFKAFFKRARELSFNQPRDLPQLISLIHPYGYHDSLISQDYLGNIASVRFAQSVSFKPIIYKHQVLTIKQIPSKHALDINGNDIIFVHSNSITQPLIIDKKHARMPAFISMTPGQAAHIFTYIKAPNHTLMEFIESFFKLPDMRVTKIFWIKKLQCKKTCSLTPLTALIPTITMTLYDVIIMNNAFTSESFISSKAASLPKGFTGAYVTLKVGKIPHSFKITWPYTKVQESITIDRQYNQYYKEELEAYCAELLKNNTLYQDSIAIQESSHDQHINNR